MSLTIVAVGVLTFMAFTIRVITGFGSAILLSPIFSNIFPPKESIVLIMLLESFVNVIFILRERMIIGLKEVYAGAFAGIAVGISFFGVASQQLIGMLIGVGMAVLAVLMLIGVNFKVRDSKPMFLSLGFISGAMGVLTGVNGPQIILGLTNQGYNAAFIRSFIITYLVIIDTVTLAAFFAFGYVNMGVLTKFVFLAPFIVFSYVVGRSILSKLKSDSLRRFMLFAVIVLSLTLIVRYGGDVLG